MLSSPGGGYVQSFFFEFHVGSFYCTFFFRKKGEGKLQERPEDIASPQVAKVLWSVFISAFPAMK